MSLPPATSWWKKLAVSTKSGNNIDILFLCLDRGGGESAEDPTIFWELRRVLPHLFRIGNDTWRLVNALLPHWKEISTTMGLVFQDHFHTTSKGMKAHPEMFPDPNKLAPEYEVSTLLFILVLADRTNFRYEKVREAATGMLQCFLRNVCGADAGTSCLINELPRDLLEANGVDPDQMEDSLTSVSAKLLESMTLDSSPQDLVAQQVLILHGHSGDHPAVQDTLERYMWNLANHIDEGKEWRSSFEDDHLKRGQDLVVQGQKKRCRMDAGLQRALGEEISTKKLASTTGAFLKSHDVYSSKHGHRFNEKFLCSHVAASWLQFSGVEHYSICSDGVRSGCPATENLIAPAVNIDSGCATWLPPVELPDGQIEDPLPSDASKRAAARQAQGEKIAAKMAAFFEALEQDSRLAKADASSAGDCQRKANMFYGLALDKAMQTGTGVSTKHFLPAVVLKPLAKDEHRFLREVNVPPFGEVPKSFIENVSTKKERLEHPVDVVGDKAYEPTLYVSLDRCSVGRQLLDFLQIRLGLRVLVQYDIWHIVEGIIKKTYGRTNTQVKRLEAAVAYRSFSGPWNSHAFWQQFKKSGDHFFRTAGPDNPCYLACYRRICADRCISLEAQLQPGHRERLWASLPNSQVMQSLGMQPVLGRWGNFETKHENLRNDRSVVLCVLLYMGIQKGWWAKVSDSPLNKIMPEILDDDAAAGDEHHEDDGLEDAPAPPAASGAAGSSDDHKKKSLKQARADVAKMRGKRANTLDFASHFFADQTGFMMLDAVVAANAPLVEFFRVNLSTHKTLMGQSHLFTSIAEGLLSGVIDECWQQMCNPAVLRSVGLVDAGGSTAAPAADEQQIAQLLFDSVVCVTGDLAVYEFEFGHSVHGIAPLLVDSSAEGAKQVLDKLKDWWGLLEDLEKDMRYSPKLRSMWEHFWWPSCQWDREIMIDLYQVGFSKVTDYTTTKVRKYQQALRTSLPSELGGNALRSRERAVLGGKLTDVEKWHTLVTSSVLPDYERRPVTITPTAEQSRCLKLDNTMFGTNDWVHSLGPDFDKLGGEADWLSTTHEERMLCFVSWASFVALRGDWQAHMRLWQSVLPIPGHALFHTIDKRGGIVCNATKYGVIVKSFEVWSHGGIRYFSPRKAPPGGKSWELWLVADCKEWKMAAVRAVCPAELLKLGAPMERCGEVALTHDTRFEDGKGRGSLVAFSSLMGLPGLTVETMKMLVTTLEIKPKRMPSTEKTLFTLIFKYSFPEASQEFLNSCYARRQAATSRRLKEMDDSTLSANWEHADGVLAEKDSDEIKVIVRRARAALEEKVRASLAGVTTESRGDLIALEFARSFLPPGCTLHKDVVLHWRWVGEMPHRPKKPDFVSKVWEPKSGLTESQALQFVLEQLWAWHVEDSPGAKCPHDFSAAF